MRASPRRILVSFLALATALAAAGCAGRSGRVMSDDEAQGVDVRQASVDVLDGMMQRGTEAILARAQSRLAGTTERPRLIFAGIQNNTDERLGEKKDYMYDTVDTVVGRYGTFDMVSRTFVENVLDQLGHAPRAELLINPKVRRDVVARFEQMEGRDYVRYILWGKLDNATSDVGGDTTQKKYLLVMELVDVRTGLQDKEIVDSRKEYTR